MTPVSGIDVSGTQLPPAIAGAENTPAEPQSVPQKPAVDKYVPEEKQEPSGLYWIEPDEDGNPKIRFDDPDRPEKSPEITHGSTDAVDREIENLKKEKQKLAQQLSRETDEAARQHLERRLSQIENELRRKDNDAYRRQHTVFS